MVERQFDLLKQLEAYNLGYEGIHDQAEETVKSLTPQDED